MATISTGPFKGKDFSELSDEYVQKALAASCNPSHPFTPEDVKGLQETVSIRDRLKNNLRATRKTQGKL